MIFKGVRSYNWSIRKYFYTIPFTLFGRGLFWKSGGYFIIVSSAAIWNNSTSPENYYVNQAPVYLNWGYILLLNVLTVSVCFFGSVNPSYIITRYRL
jgi:lipoprotein-releasing system permease protein